MPTLEPAPQADAPRLLEEGFSYHQRSMLGDAAARYRQVLALDPGSYDALQLLGLVPHLSGAHVESAHRLNRAVAVESREEAWRNLAVVWLDTGDFVRSSRAARRAIALDPTRPTYGLLAESLYGLGRPVFNLTMRRLATDAHDAGAWLIQGMTADAGRDAPAIRRAFRRALATAPGVGPAALAVATTCDGPARSLWRRVAYWLNPLDRQAQRAMADAMLAPDPGNPCSLRRALALAPCLEDAHHRLGNLDSASIGTAYAGGRHRRALASNPMLAGTRLQLGNVEKLKHHLAAAGANYRRALAIDPRFAIAWNNLGNIGRDCGDLDLAVSAYERAHASAVDDPALHSNLLQLLQFDPRYDSATILARHRAWWRTHRARAEVRRHANLADPERPLTIGYVSADFRRHPVGFFLLPVLENRDRRQARTICYANDPGRDDMTDRIEGAVDAWVHISELSDEAANARIRADDVDVLVDLSGHTALNRLPLFTRRAAPVQITWLGYFDTTGVEEFDAVLTDTYEVPPGEERWFTEPVIRLSAGRYCYMPPSYAPDVGPLPADRNGVITFGCFNNIAKITPDVIEEWVGLLATVPASRLLLKWHSFAEPSIRQRFRAMFAAQGLSPERLAFAAGTDHPTMLGEYNDVDIALDPFPFSGCLTSLEALWMGVPVVTLNGQRPVGRQSSAILSRIGLTELSASSLDDYRSVAAALANDRPRLTRIRRELRSHISSSGILDHSGFTREYEGVVRKLWSQWCRTRR